MKKVSFVLAGLALLLVSVSVLGMLKTRLQRKSV